MCKKRRQRGCKFYPLDFLKGIILVILHEFYHLVDLKSFNVLIFLTFGEICYGSERV